MANKLILCVDDHPDNSEMMKVWLSMQGYEVKTATSCAEAVQVVQRDPVAVSILDARLGDGDGFDLCQRILAQSPTTKVILNSGDTRPEMVDQAKTAGAMAFFAKPINFDEMRAVIDQLIGQ